MEGPTLKDALQERPPVGREVSRAKPEGTASAWPVHHNQHQASAHSSLERLPYASGGT